MLDGTFDDDLVHAWLDCLRDNAWISLHYESPALMGTDRGEIHGGGYVRRRGEFSEASSRTIWTLEDIKFNGLPANRLTHFGVWNAKNRGKIRAWGRLPQEEGVIIHQGGGYLLRAGTLALSIQ